VSFSVEASPLAPVPCLLVEATDTPVANVRVWIHDVPKENCGIAGVSAKYFWR